MKCQDCQKRHENCHSNCPDYLAYREELELRKASLEHFEEFNKYAANHKSSIERKNAVRNKGRMYK